MLQRKLLLVSVAGVKPCNSYTVCSHGSETKSGFGVATNFRIQPCVNYLRRRLAIIASGESIVAWRLCVCLYVRPAATSRSIRLGGEGNAQYPVFSSY